MTALFTLIHAVWPFVAGGAVALLSLLYAFVKGRNADTKTAQAGQREAAAKADAERAKAQTATVRDADAQANADAARAGLDAVQERQAIEAGSAGQSHEEIQHEVDQWRK